MSHPQQPPHDPNQPYGPSYGQQYSNPNQMPPSQPPPPYVRQGPMQPPPGYGHQGFQPPPMQPQPVVIPPAKINHALHAVLTFLTCGAWGLLVWLPIAIFSRKKARVEYR